MREKWQREVAVALNAIQEAAGLARRIREREGDRSIEKLDTSPVTIADYAVQALIAHRLARAFPSDRIVAEEDAGLLRRGQEPAALAAILDALAVGVPELAPADVLEAIDRGCGAPADRFWTLDPIDGTRGFLRGDQYAVALALIVDGQVEVGVLGCPMLRLAQEPVQNPGALALAVRGGGARRMALSDDGVVALRVSRCRDVGRARVLQSFESRHMDVDVFSAIVRALHLKTPPVPMDSQAEHVVIAAGEADLLVRVPSTGPGHEKIWDHAAGVLIVEEAGGWVTDLAGRPLEFGTSRLMSRNHGVIASNGYLHDVALRAAQQAIPAIRV